MQVQIFTLPLMPEAAEMEEMNHFLRAHKVIDVRKELVQMGGSAFWTFCVTYTQGAPSLSDASSPQSSPKSSLAFTPKRHFTLPKCRFGV